MRNKRIFPITFSAIAALCAVATNFAFGFAATGHQLVALVSEQELTTATRHAIHALLGQETLRDVSTWADEERERDRSTSHWHYVDYNIKTGKMEGEATTQPTILDAISSNSVALRSPEATTETRQRALKFLVHFLADLHQPLHCADNNDAGGNRTHVILNGERTRLHRVWDGPVVDRMIADLHPGKSLEEVAARIHAKFLKERDAFLAGNPEGWARQSFEIAKNHVYALPQPPEPGKEPVLDDNYMKKGGEIIEEQIAKAGFRLAHTLNTLLDPAYAKAHAAQLQAAPGHGNNGRKTPAASRRESAEPAGVH